MSRKRRIRTYGAKDQRKRRQNIAGAMVIAMVSLVLVGVLGMRAMLAERRVAIDEGTMCPLAGPAAYTAVLIDGTDTFSPIQVADLQRYFGVLSGEVREFEQIAVYAPKEMSQVSLLTPLIKVCNPGNGEGISGLTANPAAIQRRYDRDYAAKIDEALGQGLDAQGADSSPIMEMIQAVAIDSFPVSDARPKRLVIVSDMLQNSTYYSHYRDAIAFDTLRSSPDFQHVVTDLTGVDIEVLYIGRRGSEHLQTNRHGVFWEAYFQYMNGDLLSIRRIGG